ncbi:hypothetical protein DUNSADRAFT_9255, partial [Dunaliella salina]
GGKQGGPLPAEHRGQDGQCNTPFVCTKHKVKQEGGQCRSKQGGHQAERRSSGGGRVESTPGRASGAQGKRAAASAFEDLASRAAKRTRVLGGFFGGLGFLLTGFKTQQASERESTEAAIQHNGGVLVTLPPPPSPKKRGSPNTTGRGSRRGSAVHEGHEYGGSASQPEAAFPDIVIAPNAERRTHRLLSAMSRGAAMLSVDWVQHCAYMACYVPPDAHPDPGFHVMQPPRPHLRPHGLFAGHVVFLAGSDKFRQDFGAVMGHAGATLLESLEDCCCPGDTHEHSPAGIQQDPVVTLFILEHRFGLFEGTEAAPDDEWPRNSGYGAGSGGGGGGGSGATAGRRGGGRRGGFGRGNSGAGLGSGASRGSGGRGMMGNAEEGGEGGSGDVHSLMQATLHAARRLRVPWLDRDEIMEVIMNGSLPPQLVLPCSPSPNLRPSSSSHRPPHPTTAPHRQQQQQHQDQQQQLQRQKQASPFVLLPPARSPAPHPSPSPSKQPLRSPKKGTPPAAHGDAAVVLGGTHSRNGGHAEDSRGGGFSFKYFHSTRLQRRGVRGGHGGGGEGRAEEEEVEEEEEGEGMPLDVDETPQLFEGPQLERAGRGAPGGTTSHGGIGGGGGVGGSGGRRRSSGARASPGAGGKASRSPSPVGQVAAAAAAAPAGAAANPKAGIGKITSPAPAVVQASKANTAATAAAERRASNSPRPHHSSIPLANASAPALIATAPRRTPPSPPSPALKPPRHPVQIPTSSPQAAQQQQPSPPHAPHANHALPVGASPRSSRKTAAGAAVEWLGPAVAPQPHCPLPSTPHRTFYTSFLLQLHAPQHEEVVHVGDCVVLEMLPGEVLPRIVRLQCLWEEQPSAGQPRMLARGS